MHARHTRTLRGAAASAVATWTAAVSHTVGGGEAPAPLLLLVITILAVPVAVALAGRRLGLVRLSLTVLAAQVLLHVAFAATAGTGGTVLGHVHGRTMTFGPGAASVAPDVAMLIAHVAAAIFTVALLHRGERMLRALGRGIARLVALPSEVVIPSWPAVRTRAARRRVAPLRRLLTDVVSRRGPPAVVTAA
ncbi:hypothetical protein [Microbacterium sp. NPDC055357]